MDPADPIAATYQRIFPGLFKPLAAMPPDLQRHMRYPEDLFLIQAHMYRAYHMEAPRYFITARISGSFPASRKAAADCHDDPYYMIMRLPGEQQAEIILMLPMVPSQRENMIAWLAARCDPPHYGELIVYEFPKDKLVYGPFQIEARINQNTAISQQLSLWNQLGSRVIRGNLLVIPIENSILDVSPLYLRARAGTIARAQARDRSLWRPRRDGGDARRGIVGALRGTWRRARDPGCCSWNPARRRRDRFSARGTRALPSGN